MNVTIISEEALAVTFNSPTKSPKEQFLISSLLARRWKRFLKNFDHSARADTKRRECCKVSFGIENEIWRKNMTFRHSDCRDALMTCFFHFIPLGKVNWVMKSSLCFWIGGWRWDTARYDVVEATFYSNIDWSLSKALPDVVLHDFQKINFLLKKKKWIT